MTVAWAKITIAMTLGMTRAKIAQNGHIQWTVIYKGQHRLQTRQLDNCNHNFGEFAVIHLLLSP